MPFPAGKIVLFSPAILKDLSPGAIDWITMAEARAEEFEPKVPLAASLLTAIVWLAAAGLSERFGAEWYWILELAALPILGFILWIRHLYRAQVKSDSQLPRSPSDLSSAKEALSYAYFAQAVRKWNDKFIFQKGPLRNRAKALGIELERGYRADYGDEAL